MTHTEDSAFLNAMIDLCENLAFGRKADESTLFNLTRKGVAPDNLARLAEAFCMMLVKVEAREFYLNELINDLQIRNKELEDARCNYDRSRRESATLALRNQDLQGKVYRDALTGIYNRRYMEENLKRIMTLLSASGGTLSLFMIDVDFFKKYNDTYGHSMGDDCLKTIAETLDQSVPRSDDFVARYGGEEFVVVLPNTNEHGARVLAHRLLENIRKRNIPHATSDVEDRVTISIGITTGNTACAHEISDYIKRADGALYLSKQNGRNQYTHLGFADQPGETAVAESMIVSAARNGVP